MQGMDAAVWFVLFFIVVIESIQHCRTQRVQRKRSLTILLFVIHLFLHGDCHLTMNPSMQEPQVGIGTY